MRVISPNPEGPIPPDYLWVRYVDGQVEATSGGVTIRFDSFAEAEGMASSISELLTVRPLEHALSQVHDGQDERDDAEHDEGGSHGGHS